MTIIIKNYDIKYLNDCIKLDMELQKHYSEKYSDEVWGKKEFKKVLPKKFQLSKLLIKKNIYGGEIKDNEDLVIGFAIVSYKKENNDMVIHLHRFGISYIYQNKGFGNKLLNNLIEDVKILGYDAISLYVNKMNIQAIKFYEKNNFRIIDKMEDNFMMKYIFKKEE